MELYRNQKELLNWLTEFAKGGSTENVCIVEGFSGLGKTSIARQLQIKCIGSSFKALLLTLPDGVLSIDDFFLELASELSSADIYGLEEAFSNGKSLTIALRNILEKEDIWIIIDEFQNISNEEGKLMDEVQRLIGNVSTHSTKGKIIAFSNQFIWRDRWSDQVVFKKLNGPSSEEAIHRLDKLMHEKEINETIEKDKKLDIVRILGNNPRAINVFTDRWRWASNLDELLGEIPDIWEARDREISPRLLKELEEQLIRKSLERFTPDEVRVLEGLAVLRKPFQKEAIERALSNTAEAARIREKFQRYFFLDNNLSWFSFHPILKEICKLNLTTNKSSFKRAHSKAAEYYTRHFTQANLKSPGKLGGYFVEARYHLIMAESEDKLQSVSANFEYFIRTTINIKAVSAIPVDRQLLDERIGLLSAFLGNGGPKGLEWHLAKCLEKRGLEGDDKQALLHVARAIGENTPVETWLLKMRLEAKIEGLLIAIDTGYTAISRTPASQNSFALYQFCAELMTNAGQLDEAIKLLREGIKEISPGNNSFALYQFCAELLDNSGLVIEAIRLLKKGIKEIPPANNVVSLYQFCAKLMSKSGDVDEAIELLQKGIAEIPPANSVVSLYQFCAELMNSEGQVDEAIKLLKRGIGRITAGNNSFTLYQFCAELMSKAGQIDEGIRLLEKGIGEIPANNNSFTLYQSCAELMSKTGRVDEAIKLLRKGIKEIPPANSVVSLYQFCAELMDKQGRVDEAIKLLREGITKVPANLGGHKLIVQILLCCYRDSKLFILKEFWANPYSKQQQNLALLLFEYADGNFEKAKELFESSDILAKNYVPFISQVVFGLLASGKFSEGDSTLSQSKLQPGKNPGITWLLALNALKNNHPEHTYKYYQELDPHIPPGETITMRHLVKFWHDSRNEKSSPLYFFPHLPATLTGYSLKLSANSPNLKEEVLQSISTGFEGQENRTKSGLSILTISTEWFSKNGGLSTFNRLLCENLARSGNIVCCLVPEASDEEKKAAMMEKVTLIEASTSPGFNQMERLNLKVQLPIGFSPQIIIGHDRVTGPSMVVQKRDFLPESKSVLLIHTAPEEIEWHKPIQQDKTISQKAEERVRLQIDLSKQADLVVAVGQKLYDEISTQLSGIGNPPPTYQFNPGISDTIPDIPKTVAPKTFCLLLGRADDFELKGVDIAAKALDLVSKHWEEDNKPILIIRGAKVGTGDSLKKRVEEFTSHGLEVRVKEYSSDMGVLREEMLRASVVLMPSRTEGFGLVGLEAIEARCPALFSSNSGLAKMLNQFAPHHADNWIVNTTGDLDKDALAWSEKIRMVLHDRSASNNRIEQLYNHLRESVSWSDSTNRIVSIMKSFE